MFVVGVVSREEGRGRHSCNNRSWDWAVFGGASRPVLSMCGVVWGGNVTDTHGHIKVRDEGITLEATRLLTRGALEQGTLPLT